MEQDKAFKVYNLLEEAEHLADCTRGLSFVIGPSQNELYRFNEGQPGYEVIKQAVQNRLDEIDKEIESL